MKKKKPTVVSLFCGIGGSSLGYKMAGYRELMGVDWDRLALAVFQRNFPEVPAYRANLFTCTPKELMAAAGIRAKGQLDVLDGSPPCQGFSQIRGSKRDGDKRNTLVQRYAEMVLALRPKVAIMENVPGMATRRMLPLLDDLVITLQRGGYKVRWDVLSAADYGVPQDRRRVILIAHRADLGTEPAFPKPRGERISVEKALAEVEDANGIPLDGLPIPGEARRLLKLMRQGEVLEDVVNREYGYPYYGFNDRRLVAEKPAFTLAATTRIGQGGYMIHPTEDRLLSVEELKVLCGFPREFQLAGTYEDRVKGLGNAVMPPMMAAVAGKVKEVL